MEAHEATESVEHHGHGDGGFKSRAALLVSLLAMVLAIASLGGSNAAKDATQENILAANAYNFYQAKSIRQTTYKVAADELEITLSKDDKLNPASKELITKKLEAYRKNIDRYESEPDTGEGKKELMAKARALEAERDLVRKSGPWLTFSGMSYQLGIVLLSASILAVSVPMFWGSIAVSAVGALLMSQGIWLWIPGV